MSSLCGRIDQNSIAYFDPALGKHDPHDTALILRSRYESCLESRFAIVTFQAIAHGFAWTILLPDGKYGLLCTEFFFFERKDEA
jgi:hypothetical protein